MDQEEKKMLIDVLSKLAEAVGNLECEMDPSYCGKTASDSAGDKVKALAEKFGV